MTIIPIPITILPIPITTIPIPVPAAGHQQELESESGASGWLLVPGLTHISRRRDPHSREYITPPASVVLAIGETVGAGKGEEKGRKGWGVASGHQKGLGRRETRRVENV